MVFLSLLSMVQSSVVWVGMAAGEAGPPLHSLTAGRQALIELHNQMSEDRPAGPTNLFKRKRKCTTRQASLSACAASRAAV
jgi:hypothetical protein